MDHTHRYYTENKKEKLLEFFSYIMITILGGGRLYAMLCYNNGLQQHAQAFFYAEKCLVE